MVPIRSRYGTVLYGTVRYCTVPVLYHTNLLLEVLHRRKIHIAASTVASGRTNCREWSGYFICGVGGDAGGGVDGDVVVAFGVGAGDIPLSKRNIRGPNEWCVLLPLNPQGLLREAPRK